MAATTTRTSAMVVTSSVVSRNTLVNQLGKSPIALSIFRRGSAALSVAAPRASRPAAVSVDHQTRTKTAGTAGAALTTHRDGFVQGNSTAIPMQKIPNGKICE